MTRRLVHPAHRRFALFALSLATLLAAPAAADHSKLDPRARIALSRLRAGASPAALAADRAAVTAAGDLDVFIEGAVPRSALEAAGAIVRTGLPGLFTAFVPADAIAAVASLPGVRAVRGSAPVEPELDVSVATTAANTLRGSGPDFTGLNGEGVLVGDVDTGVDYGHGDFVDALGQSRFVSLWDQNAAGTNPAGFAYGDECTQAQLTAGTCPETDGIANGGHGTHVMGIAGGDGSQSANPYLYAGMAPRADLCLVATNFQNTSIVDGVAYVFDRATARGENCVVNLSLGTHYGPHDGTSPFEAALSAMCGPGRVIVKSAGNERSTTNIRHAAVNAAGAGASVTLGVSGSAAGRRLAIDGYYEGSETIDVQITTPDGTVIGPLALGGTDAAYPGLATPSGTVYLENGVSLTSGGAREVYVEILATGSSSNGTWTFRFIPVALGAANGRVDLWRYYSSSAAFVGNFAIGAANYQMLISEPGNADALITAAAWVTKQGWTACDGASSQFPGTPPPGPLASFSSMGPTRDGRIKPDITAPGLAVISTRSFDYANACPVSGASVLADDGANHIANFGTSMAAPHVAGAVALLMQKYGAITPSFARSYLASHALTDAWTGVVPNNDWGAGKLRLGDLLDPVVRVTSPNGGETAVIGGAQLLTWGASDNVAVAGVDLELSRNGDAGPWETIATAAPNTGSFVWTVSGPPTEHARLRATARDAEGNAGADASDADFAIQDAVTDALLSLFEVQAAGDAVVLRWRFADGTAFRSVEAQRAPEPAGPWETLPMPPADEGGVSVVVDRAAAPGRSSWYRLRAVTGRGEVKLFGPLAGAPSPGVSDPTLDPVAPNPTPGAVRVGFALPRTAAVALTVIDLQGREVATLVRGPFRAGRYQATWSGRTANGPAAAGVYFLRLSAGGRTLVRRIVVAP